MAMPKEDEAVKGLGVAWSEIATMTESASAHTKP
jgi:hypothetical protein